MILNLHLELPQSSGGYLLFSLEHIRINSLEKCPERTLPDNNIKGTSLFVIHLNFQQASGRQSQVFYPKLDKHSKRI